MFGLAPTNAWNAWNWDEFLWGEGTADMPIIFTKVVDSTVTPDDDIVKYQTKVIDSDLSISGDMQSEELMDANGYSYVYPSNASDLEDRDPTTWSQGSNSTASWSTGVATSTTWSAA